MFTMKTFWKDEKVRGRERVCEGEKSENNEFKFFIWTWSFDACDNMLLKWKKKCSRKNMWNVLLALVENDSIHPPGIPRRINKKWRWDEITKWKTSEQEPLMSTQNWKWNDWIWWRWMITSSGWKDLWHFWWNDKLCFEFAMISSQWNYFYVGFI